MSDNDKNEETPQAPAPTISKQIFDSLMAFYSPAETPAEADEQKSTYELIEEMGEIEEITPAAVNKLMMNDGFRLHYTGMGYVWLLNIKPSRFCKP